jgi:hypothetical protein
MPIEVGVRGPPAEHQSGRVGEDDAHRLTVQVLVHAAQHRLGASGEWGVDVEVADVWQLDLVRCDPQGTGSPPGRKDGGTDAARFNPLAGEEADPADRQVVPVGWNSVASW